MKKNTIKAFTLVEMLIVIVIIGILIAALMPRMQAAQGRARDVSRKTALSQIQSAIVVSQGDKGEWPLQTASNEDVPCTQDDINNNVEGCEKDGDKKIKQGESATQGIAVSKISSQLKAAGMNSVPVDPLKSEVTGLGNFKGNTEGDYGYLVATRNGTPEGGFALMAKTEVEGGSNRVVCTDTNDKITAGEITGGTDLANIQLCETITEGSCSNDRNGTCGYASDSELRYLLIY